MKRNTHNSKAAKAKAAEAKSLNAGSRSAVAVATRFATGGGFHASAPKGASVDLFDGEDGEVDAVDSIWL